MNMNSDRFCSPIEASEKRSMAARKAAATRRAKEKARRAEFRRRVFMLCQEDLAMEHYGPRWEILYNQPEAFEPTKYFTLADVLDDVRQRFSFRTHDDPEATEDDEVGFGGMDLTVWRDGRLLAVIRKGHDDQPVVTHFTD
jgi:hypothetical protein